MANTTIEIKNLVKSFKKLKAVNDISLTVNEGEIVGFVGPNGAGKTTTISVLLGFINATKGSAVILNQTIKPASSHLSHRHIGYVAGDMALFDNLTGLQYLDFFANQYANREYRQQLIERLKPQLNVRIKNLSRGNKQKIALVGALQHNPKIIILDEPTSGLDPIMQKVFLDIITEKANSGASVFMSSHILNEVAEIADRVVFMRDGKIIFNQPMTDIKKRQGKHIEIYASSTEIEKIKKSLSENSFIINSSKTSLKFRYADFKLPLNKWLATYKIDDFNVKNETLEDMFEQLYSEADIK